MVNLTHQNYLHWSYDGRDFGLRRSEDELFSISYDPVPWAPEDLRTECIRAARLIAERAGGQDIWVAYSGGSDSEACLLSFLQAGLRPIAATARFKHDLNEHDTHWSYDFCRRHGIRHEVFDVDVADFWATRLLEYTDPIQCVSPQFPLTLWLVDQMEGYPVIASGDSALKREQETDIFHFVEEEKLLAYYRHLLVRGREGVPGFFQYTPQQVLGYMRDEALREFVNGGARRERVLSAKQFKCKVYQRYFDLKYRPAVNGFEKLSELDAFYRAQLKARYPGAGATVEFEYNSYVRLLQNLCDGNRPHSIG